MDGRYGDVAPRKAVPLNLVGPDGQPLPIDHVSGTNVKGKPFAILGTGPSIYDILDPDQFFADRYIVGLNQAARFMRVDAIFMVDIYAMAKYHPYITDVVTESPEFLIVTLPYMLLSLEGCDAVPEPDYVVQVSLGLFSSQFPSFHRSIGTGFFLTVVVQGRGSLGTPRNFELMQQFVTFM